MSFVADAIHRDDIRRQTSDELKTWERHIAVPPPVAHVIRQAIGELLSTTIARLEALASGKIKSGERPPNGPWVDITKRAIEELKQRIAKLEALKASVEAKPGT